MQKYDVIVIGAGPGGRFLAKQLIHEGRKTAIVSLNDDSASSFDRLIETLTHQSPAPPLAPHGPEGVDTYRGTPHFVENSPFLHIGDEQLAAPHFVLATGVLPWIPPIQGTAETPHTSALTYFDQSIEPKRPLIIGGGPLGVCLALYLKKKGADPILMVKTNRVLPKAEASISAFALETLTSQKIDVRLNAECLQVRPLNNENVGVVYTHQDQQLDCETDALIFSTGLQGNTEFLNLKSKQVYKNEHGFVAVNDQMQTSCSKVWALGPVTGAPFSLALEKHHSNIITNNISSPFFSQWRLEKEAFPQIIPFDPPIASVGLTEEQAKKKYRDVKAIHINLNGYCSLVGRKKGGRILGAHLACPHASELILFLNLAMRAELSFFDLLDRQHYPSPSQADLLYLALSTWTKT